jgi:hypothetical protein
VHEDLGETSLRTSWTRSGVGCPRKVLPALGRERHRQQRGRGGRGEGEREQANLSKCVGEGRWGHGEDE